MADGTIVVNQTMNGNVQQNVLVFSNFPETDVSRQTFADAFRLIFLAEVTTADKSGLWSLNNLTFVYNDSLPIFSVTVPFTDGPVTGANPNDALPLQVAHLCSLQYVGPPPNRGRVYFGGYTEAAVGASGLFGQGILDANQSFLENLIDGVSYTGGAEVAFLRIGRRSSAGELIASSPITAVVPRFIPAIQRRRRQGQGI